MTRFDEITDLFGSVDGTDRLDLLLDYAGRLPDLPPEDAALREAGLGMVHECQSPVYLRVVPEGEVVRVRAYAPDEAPTARAFVSILTEAFDRATPQEIAAAPADALGALGLAGLLGMQRTRGLGAVYARLRREAAAAFAPA